MQLHIIGGFLGSGKTTAIIGAARHLAARGHRVGVITNDQGRHLVDTLIMQAEQLPAMEVTGGCFCCNFDDLNERLYDLIEAHHPDIIFAESVGSCADVVATVVKPLLELQIGALKPSSYTVFVDIRLLHRFLYDLEMPFSEDITYIFGKQIEEAGILYINKSDLVDNDFVESVLKSARTAYPSTAIILGSALSATDIPGWVDGLLATNNDNLPMRSLHIDYDQYARGENRLVWVDRKYLIKAKAEEMPSLLRGVLEAWKTLIDGHSWTSGHLKAVINAGDTSIKISLAQSGEVISGESLSNFLPDNVFSITDVTLLLNLLVEGELDEIQEKMDIAIQRYLDGAGAQLEILQSFARQPDYPKPTHRIA